MLCCRNFTSWEFCCTQITGKEGEAAVVAFDCRIATPQDFTTDNDKIKVAINNIHVGSSGTRMIDAVEQGVFMLADGRHQPPGCAAGQRNAR